MKQDNKVLRNLILFQFGILIIFAVVFFVKSRNPYSMTIDPAACEGSSSFNGAENKTEEVTDILKTPSFPLKAGAYTLLIDYTATEDQMFRILNDYSSDWIDYPTGRLKRGYTRSDYDFVIKRDLDDVDITVQYLPSGGSIDIKGISISGSTKPLKKWFFILIALFACIDLIYLKRDVLRHNRNTALALLGLILITSLPLFVYGTDGSDLPYSLLRIEGLYKTLISGQFPTRMNTFILDGAGYPGSIFYGDIFLYPAALLRMAGFNVTEVWKIIVFLLNSATALIAYFCFKGINGNNKLAHIMTFAYCSAPFHMEAVYYRGALGEMTAYVFFPVIAYALYKIYTCEPDKKSSGRLSTILALGLSAVLCSHLLSTEMLGILLIILFILLYKKSFTKNVLITLVKAGFKTVLISLYYLVPFVEYFLKVPTRISDTVAEDLIPIQARGTYISEFFSFLTFFDKADRVPFNPDGPGLILIAAFIAGITMWIGSKADRTLKISLIMSAITMFIASNLFPWDFLIGHTSIGRLMSQVQHPTRYISFAVIFLVIALMNVLKGRDNRTLRICLEVIICFTVFSMSVFTSQYESTMTINHPVNSSDLDSLAVGNAEYALSGSDIFENAYTIAANNNKDHVISMMNRGINMTVQCRGGESGTDLILPRYNYRYLNVYDDAGHRLEKSSGHDMGGEDNNLIKITLPAGYEGNIYVRFDEPISWRLAELISLAAIIFLAVKSSQKKYQ